MAQELKARISLRKDSLTKWSRNSDQELYDGEVIFVEGVPGSNTTRLIIGNGGETVNNALNGDNTKTLTTTGKNFLRDASKVHDPTQRSTNCNIFYSGVGAGYTLPTASETLLGGIKIDSDLFYTIEDRLYLKYMYLRVEAGKGKVVHIGNGVSLEVDDNLYVNTLRATDHYTQLGHLFDLNKDVTRKLNSLSGELWEFVGEIDPLELYDSVLLENIPFIIYIPHVEPEEGESEPTTPTEPEEEIILYDKIYIQNGVITFADKEEKVKTTVYDSQHWLNERFRTIQFLTDNTNISYMRATYINKLLRLGNPIPTNKTEMEVTPLSRSDKPYAGMIVHNWKYENNNARHAFFGMDYNGRLFYSKNFDLLTKRPILGSERYVLTSDVDYMDKDYENFILHVSVANDGQHVVKASDIANFITPEYMFNRLTTDENGPISIENKEKISINHKEADTKEDIKTNEYEYFITNITFDKYGHLKTVEKIKSNDLTKDIYDTKTTLNNLITNEIGSQNGTDEYTLWWYAQENKKSINSINAQLGKYGEEDSATIWGLLDINSTQIGTINTQIEGINGIIGTYDIEEFDPIAVRLTDLEITAGAFTDGKLGKPSNENEKRTVWEIIKTIGEPSDENEKRTVWKIIEALEEKVAALENELNMLKQ